MIENIEKLPFLKYLTEAISELKSCWMKHVRPAFLPKKSARRQKKINIIAITLTSKI